VSLAKRRIRQIISTEHLNGRKKSGVQGSGRSKLRPLSPEWIRQRAQQAAPAAGKTDRMPD
ncbi:MAG: hypothetical protein LC121_07115, partial [Anaerolineae bacterium]|nr:hypothetical protein [Anaerolineae bacterium]